MTATMLAGSATITVASAEPAAAVGRTFYVSPGGSDLAAGTSPSRPWRSLDRVSRATLRPGDRVLLRGGASFSGRLRITDSGTSADPIQVGAYGSGGRPVVTGSCLWLDGNHIVVTRVWTRSCDWAGFSVGGDQVRLTGVKATGSIAGVNIREGADSAVVNRSTIVNNRRLDTNTPGGHDDNGAFGVLVRGDAARIVQNRIHGHRARTHDYGMDGAAVEIIDAAGTRVLHNRASGNNALSELTGRGTRNTTFAYNRVTSSLEESRFVILRGHDTSLGPHLGTLLAHNTVRLTGAASQGFVCHAGCARDVLSVRANIVVARQKAGYADGPIAGGYNLWWGGQRQFRLTRGDVQSPPGWVDARRGNLTLRRSSRAVDLERRAARWLRDLLGHAVPLDGNGDGRSYPDAGAYERRRR